MLCANEFPGIDMRGGAELDQMGVRCFDGQSDLREQRRRNSPGGAARIAHCRNSTGLVCPAGLAHPGRAGGGTDLVINPDAGRDIIRQLAVLPDTRLSILAATGPAYSCGLTLPTS